MPEPRRLQAADAFWKETDGVEQQVEAMALLARHLKARPKFVQGLPVERRARDPRTTRGSRRCLRPGCSSATTSRISARC